MFRQRIKNIPELDGFISPVRFYKYNKDEKPGAIPQTPSMVVAQGLVGLMPLTSEPKIIGKHNARVRVTGLIKEVQEPDQAFEGYSTPFVELIKILKDRTWPPRTAEVVGGLGIVTAVNIAQIWTTTLLEFGFRTAGALLLLPMSLVHETKPDGKKLHPVIRLALSVFPALPCWCIGKTLDLAGDVFSYSRTLLDSASRLLNPIWWLCKADNSRRVKNKESGVTPLPSMTGLVRNFFTSAAKLLPATFIVLTGLFTGGVSIPVLQGLAAPLSAVGNAIVAPLGSSLAASIAGGIGVGGAVAATSKVFSGTVGGVSEYLGGAEMTKAQARAKLRDDRASFDPDRLALLVPDEPETEEKQPAVVVTSSSHGSFIKQGIEGGGNSGYPLTSDPSSSASDSLDQGVRTSDTAADKSFTTAGTDVGKRHEGSVPSGGKTTTLANK